MPAPVLQFKTFALYPAVDLEADKVREWLATRPNILDIFRIEGGLVISYNNLIKGPNLKIAIIASGSSPAIRQEGNLNAWAQVHPYAKISFMVQHRFLLYLFYE